MTTAVLCVSVAANAAPSQSAILGKEPVVRYMEQTPAAAPSEPQDSAAAPGEQGGAPASLDDRTYLVETASPGDTMTRQGPEVAIARLNPEFAARLAGAIREARGAGLPSAGIFSAYRPPAFGVGGFADKFNSLHSYGLAVDMSGIGEPGSKDARLWHEIAAKHGVFCPYGADNRKEWNHCQATPMLKVSTENPLRATITADGPAQLDQMFKVANAVIVDLPTAIGMAQAANTADHSAANRTNVAEPAAARPERFAHDALRRFRAAAAGAHAQAWRRMGTKKIMLAGLAVRQLEKSQRKEPANVKAARLHRVAATSGETHHVPARRRSRSA